MKIGILALQGAVQDHGRPLRRLGADSVEVRQPGDLAGLDGLILPGGESTVMARFLMEYDLIDPIQAFARSGRAIWGLCAGAILLCEEVDERQGVLGLLPARARRNAYGRQLSSFEEELDTVIGPFPGIFIRAPRLEILGTPPKGDRAAPGGLEILGSRRSPTMEPVLMRKGRILAASFHPELTGNDGLHAFFLQMAAERTISD
jgi:5'-phosphate synthase pdxT subunit